MPQAIIALGSNLGDRQGNIMIALEEIRDYGLKILKVSPLIETEPYGYTQQGHFLNGACITETKLAPLELLRTLLAIEREMGRTREVHWGPRNIDLDIIFYDDLIINEKELIIPHPDAHNRSFVMGPIAEIAPFFIHPVYHKTVKEINEELLNDQG